MLSLARLRLLHMLSELGTISAVANAVHLSRSAVSKQLAQLESELNVRLIERSGKDVRLTDAGRQLAARSADLLQLAERLEAEFCDPELEVAGEFRLASIGSFISSVVPVAIAGLLQTHPQLKIVVTQIEPPESLPALSSLQVDMAITPEPAARDSIDHAFDFHPLCVDVLEAVVSSSHRLAGRGSIHLSELAQEQWATSAVKLETPFGSIVSRACSEAGFVPDVVASGTSALMLELVRTSTRIAVLPHLALQQVERSPEFAVLRIEPCIRFPVGAVVKKGAHHRPVVAAVLAALARAAAALAPADA